MKITYATKKEAIEAICTHVCRFRPRLKLNPAHCAKRMEMAEHKAMGCNPLDAGTSPYWQCRDCDGPVLPEEWRVEMTINRKWKFCTTCHAKLRATLDNFYAANNSDGLTCTCIKCLVNRDRQRRARIRREAEAMEEMVTP